MCSLLPNSHPKIAEVYQEAGSWALIRLAVVRDSALRSLLASSVFGTASTRPAKALQRAKIVEQKFTINEEMSKVLNRLHVAEPQVVPEDEQQVSCFFTKKKLKTLRKAMRRSMWSSISAAPSNTLPSPPEVVSSAKSRPLSSFEPLIKASYLNWESFIEKKKKNCKNGGRWCAEAEARGGLRNFPYGTK